MEGPTPVSALIHAATMVTAGVFLIVRTSFIFEYIPNVLGFIAVTGAVTSIFAATTGLLQNDLKKVIAFSTCSQLGYMVFSCGNSNFAAGFFHLTTHAFFKAQLFLCSGSILHQINDEQDMRKMGGLKSLSAFTYSALIIGSLALIGFPFLAGFYSKDLILELVYSKYTNFGFLSYYLGALGAFFTAFYSMRLGFLTFLSKPAGHKQIICFASDSGPKICFVLCFLAILSLAIGYYSKEILVGAAIISIIVNGFFITNFIDAELIPLFFKILPVVLSLSGIFFAFTFYIFKSKLLFFIKKTCIGKKVYFFFNRK